MRRVTLILALITLASSGGLLAQNADPSWLGKWKVNVAKSKWDPASGALKSQSSSQTATADGVMVMTDQVTADGKTQHTDITYKLDGKEYPLKGAADANTMRVYTRIEAHNYQFVTKVNGKVTTTSKVAVSADGKTRTITTTGTNAQGQKVSNVTFWEKQ